MGHEARTFSVDILKHAISKVFPEKTSEKTITLSQLEFIIFLKL